LSLELIRLLVIIPLLSIFAFFGGIYAIRTLALLLRNAELKIQRKIWFPILTGGSFFAVSTLIHIFEHFPQYSILRQDEVGLLSEIILIIGYALVTIGVYQYWRLQAGYIQQKREAQQKAGRTSA